jgi:hypothetical protein
MAQNNENGLYKYGSRCGNASITNCIHSKMFQQHVVTKVTYDRGVLEGN